MTNQAEQKYIAKKNTSIVDILGILVGVGIGNAGIYWTTSLIGLQPMGYAIITGVSLAAVNYLIKYYGESYQFTKEALTIKQQYAVEFLGESKTNEIPYNSITMVSFDEEKSLIKIETESDIKRIYPDDFNKVKQVLAYNSGH